MIKKYYNQYIEEYDRDDNMNLYFLDTKIKYTLQNNNFYAYSIINTTLLSTPLDSMERGNIFEELNKISKFNPRAN